MNSLVGIDLQGYWKQAVPLLKAIGFEDIEPTFFHAVESLLPNGDFVTLPDSHPIQQMQEENEAAGRALCEEARASFGAGDVVVQYGDATGKLLNYADQRDMDLITVGSERKSTLGSLFFGSVAQGLLTGSKCSVLFGKNANFGAGKLTAVFATDHSAYANRTLEWVLEHKPAGIGRVIVLTAATVNPLISGQIMQHVENLNKTVLDLIVAGIRERNQTLAQRFISMGIDAIGEVRQQHPSHAIESAMRDHTADLLIVGAQGHGFLERLRIGSTSFEQVVNTPHNVLVVRPK